MARKQGGPLFPEHSPPHQQIAFVALGPIAANDVRGDGRLLTHPRSLATTRELRVGELGIPAVPHGSRSSLRDWTAECSDAPREACEVARAHVNTNRIETAYWRTDVCERRRALIEQWAVFLAGKRGRGGESIFERNEVQDRNVARPGESRRRSP